MATTTSLATPGVYIQEINSFPPSIAQVATAVPVFIGYTQKAQDSYGNDLTNIPFKISSLIEYSTYFGVGPNLTTVVNLNADNSVSSVSTTPSFQMYNALTMFFYNGGGDCYIHSIGKYPSTNSASLSDYIPGGTTSSCFDILRKYDEPTLIVIPDAAQMLTNSNDFNSLINAALQHCADMQSRFTIIDVPIPPATDDVITPFRSGVVGANLNYGAAYYPYLQTNLPSPAAYQNISIFKTGVATPLSNLLPAGDINVLQIINAVSDQNTFINPYITTPASSSPAVDYTTPNDVTALISGDGKGLSIVDAYKSIDSTATTSKDKLTGSIQFISDVIIDFAKLNTSFTDKQGAAGYTSAVANGSTVQEIQASYIKPGTATAFSSLEQLLLSLIQADVNYPVGGALGVISVSDVQSSAWLGATYFTQTTIPTTPDPYGTTPPTTDDAAVALIMPLVNNVFNNVMTMINNFASDIANRIASLDAAIASSSSVYSNIKSAVGNSGLTVSPSPTIAGVYAATDGARGVWKAPANVALNNVIKPTVAIDDNTQAGLNIDTNAGKSINAIRFFTGKGNLVWGARTLTGNDNNWRYVSVRRTYIMVETSTKNAAFQFVFEPNDIHTWLKVKAMIQNFLYELWQEGALAGVKPEQAYYVSVGLGQTMTSQDILEGRMIIEIGMAVVRPAEFIILRFTQIQQQS